MTNPTSPSTCPECGTEFQIGPSAKGGKNRLYCSVNCRARVANRAARARDPEKHRAQWRASHWKHREKKNAASKAWHAEHRDEQLAKQRAYYAANRDRLRAKMKEWREQNPEQAHKNNRASYAAQRASFPWKESLRGCERRARAKGLEFTLSPEWAKATWTGLCTCSGLEFATERKEKKGPGMFSPSIDRIDPSKGYTPDNCRFVLSAVNSLKHAGSDSDMVKVAMALVENMKY